MGERTKASWLLRRYGRLKACWLGFRLAGHPCAAWAAKASLLSKLPPRAATAPPRRAATVFAEMLIPIPGY
eukprot:5058033-Pleurochrysis_carterae.AAC.1